MKRPTRREMLTAMAAGAGALAAGRGAAQSDLPLMVPEWTRTQGYYAPLYGFGPNDRVTPQGVPDPNALPGGLSPLLPTTGDPMAPALRQLDPGSGWLKPDYHTPIQSQDSIYTDNGLFYIIAHCRVPLIDAAEHRLVVHGDFVGQPKVFTMQDLERLPQVKVTHFLECAGNTYQAWSPGPIEEYEHLGVQQSHGLLSGVEWTGIPVRCLFECVGLNWSPGQKQQLWVLAEGADGAVMDRSIPIEKLMKDAILAIGQNGRPLQRESGYPVRLILPGYEGNSNVKWLRRLKVGRSPWMSKEETSGYTDYLGKVPSGDPPRPGLAWQFTLPMEVKSVITNPAGGQHIEPPKKGSKVLVPLKGFAWSGLGKITRVEVKIGREDWRPATIPPAASIHSIALTPFTTQFEWDGRPLLISSRAWDETGSRQIDYRTLIAERGTGAFYHYNAIQTWRITEDGAVLNYVQPEGMVL